MLKEKVNEIQAYAVEAEEGYSLGDLIQIKGKLKIFRDKKEVVANIHSILVEMFSFKFGKHFKQY